MHKRLTSLRSDAVPRLVREITVRDTLVIGSAITSLVLSGHKAVTAAITYDEAYTYLRFAGQPISGILSDYHAPNNHILHTVLVHLSTGLYGNATWAIRLPAFLGGFAFLTAVVALSRRCPEPARSFWPIAVALTPMVMEFNALARGYSLGAASCLWALWLLIRIDARLPDTNRRFRYLVIVGALLGLSMAFVPTYAIFSVGAVAASLIVRAVQRSGMTIRQLALDGAALIVGSFPVVGVTYARIDMEPGNWMWGYAEGAEAIRAFWLGTLELARSTGSKPAYLLTAVAIAALVLSVFLAVRKHDSASLTILLAGVASFATLVALRSTIVNLWPFARILILFVPLLAFPFFHVLSAIPDRLRAVSVGIGIIMVSYLGFWTATHWSGTYYPDWHDNAGVPKAVEAIQEDLRDDDGVLRIAHPWQLDVPILYILERRDLDGWQLVPGDDPTADYRIVRAGEITSDAGLIIYKDPVADIRVLRLEAAHPR